jgi:hypothetical protein
MKRVSLLRSLLLVSLLLQSLLFLAVAPAFAQVDTVDAPAPPQGDPRVRAVLDELGYEYEVDADGDYRAVFEFEGERRSQVVYVNSQTATYDSLEIREVWSPAIESKGPLTPKIANRLLSASFDAPFGAWQCLKQANGRFLAVFAVKLGADADAAMIRKAIKAVISHADEMEKELSKKDTY